MLIYKALTKAEKKFNKKNPDHEIKPHIAFHIDEKEYPDEAKLWELLGFDNVKYGFQELNKRKKKWLF